METIANGGPCWAMPRRDGGFFRRFHTTVGFSDGERTLSMTCVGHES